MDKENKVFAWVRYTRANGFVFFDAIVGFKKYEDCNLDNIKKVICEKHGYANPDKVEIKVYQYFGTGLEFINYN